MSINMKEMHVFQSLKFDGSNDTSLLPYEVDLTSNTSSRSISLTKGICYYLKHHPLTEKHKVATWRGVMTKIICTPYTEDPWRLIVTKHKGTIFIKNDPYPERPMDDKQQLFTYYGYKFEEQFVGQLDDDSVAAGASEVSLDKKEEHYKRTRRGVDNDEELYHKSDRTDTKDLKLTDDLSDQPSIVPLPDTCINTNIQYCSVFSTKLGSHSLLLAAEIDCVSSLPSSSQTHQQKYVELKTHRVITNDRQQRSFVKFKLLKTWAQCYLAGVPKVMFGYRSDGGSIVKTEMFDTAELPRMARKEGMWDPNVCLSFGEDLLGMVADTVQEGRADSWTVTFSPSAKTVVIKATDGVCPLKDWFL